MIITILILIAVLLVLLILAAGLISLKKGGDFALRWGPRLMRWRVMAQFMVIILLLIAVWLRQ